MFAVKVFNAVSWGLSTTREVYEQAKQTAWKTVTLLAVLIVLLWLSVFIYASFYYAYLPAAVHVRDVNLQFRYYRPAHSLIHRHLERLGHGQYTKHGHRAI